MELPPWADLIDFSHFYTCTDDTMWVAKRDVDPDDLDDAVWRELAPTLIPPKATDE